MEAGNAGDGEDVGKAGSNGTDGGNQVTVVSPAPIIKVSTDD